MKLYIEQIADGVKTVVATKEDEQSARISYHNTCRNLYNDDNTQQARVRITDEEFKTYGTWEEVIDKTELYPFYKADTTYSKGDRVTYESKYYEYIADEPTEGNLPTDTDFWKEYIVPGKLIVLAVSNNNLVIKDITEWIPNKAGIKGAMVDYHGKCAMYLNAPDVIQANVRVANETLDVYEGKSEEIRHEQEPEA